MRGLLLGYDCMVFADTLESVDEVSVRVFLLSIPNTPGLKKANGRNGWTQYMVVLLYLQKFVTFNTLSEYEIE